MIANRVGADDQLLCDVIVAVSAGDEIEHLEFAASQPLKLPVWE